MIEILKPGGRTPHRRTVVPGFLAACLAAAASGCGRNDIQVYSIPKEKEPERRSASRESTGPAEIPSWKKPAHWEERGPMRMSLASFNILAASGGGAEVAIMPFPHGNASELDFLNIWRSQLGLKLLDASSVTGIAQGARMAGEPAQIYDVTARLAETDAEPAERVFVAAQARRGTLWLIKLQGSPAVVGSELGTFQTFLSGIEFKPADPGSSSRTTAQDEPLKLPDWKLPASWQPQAPPNMLLAKFTATGANAASTEITVSAFPGAAGGLLMNVNRWRGQISLNPLSNEELAKLAQTLELSGLVATVVDMSGTDSKSQKPARVIVAVIPQGGRTWFFKMMGDVQASEEQKPEFFKFIQSLRFPDA